MASALPSKNIAEVFLVHPAVLLSGPFIDGHDYGGQHCTVGESHYCDPSFKKFDRILCPPKDVSLCLETSSPDSLVAAAVLKKAVAPKNCAASPTMTWHLGLGTT